jgi:hypothetical protein
MKWSNKINEVIIWLIIVLSGAVYAYFLQRSESFEDLVISLVPAMIFLSGAIMIYSRDKYKVSKAIQHNEFEVNRRLTWFDEMRHDLLLYLTPFGVLAVPLVLGDIPSVSTVVEAGLVYLVMLYLKYMYWGEL